MGWTFDVPLTVKPPTQNSRSGSWHGPWRLRRRITDEVRLVAASELVRLQAPRATARRLLQLVYLRPRPHEAAHPLDADQVTAAMKPVVDGIVQAGWLVDDSLRWCEYPMPRQEPADRRAVRVVITEVA